jgi:hypothetical protein
MAFGARPASASPPTTVQFDITFSIQATDLCDFRVDFTGTQVGSEQESPTPMAKS